MRKQNRPCLVTIKVLELDPVTNQESWPAKEVPALFLCFGHRRMKDSTLKHPVTETVCLVELQGGHIRGVLPEKVRFVKEHSGVKFIEDLGAPVDQMKLNFGQDA